MSLWTFNADGSMTLQPIWTHPYSWVAFLYLGIGFVYSQRYTCRCEDHCAGLGQLIVMTFATAFWPLFILVNLMMGLIDAIKESRV